MKQLTLILMIALVTVSVMMAQPTKVTGQTTDILGAHLGYGRGCVMCHAPHSGSAGNGIANANAYSGNIALWGQDLTPLYGQGLAFGDAGKYAVTLPAAGTITSAGDANTAILFCLSCHDGNLAKVGMMKGHTVEALPIVGGNAPTFLGNDGTTAGNYSNDHPVGPLAVISCGAPYNWDCTGGNTTPITLGPNSTIFAANYGFPSWSNKGGVGGTYTAATFGTTVTAVTCTTCHNQHSENIYSGTIAGVAGNYTTMFFIKGYYNPANGGNSVAQFCRQCHGGSSNESEGQFTVPTT